ncbi:multidrug ABC transporter permease/ATP-binding protein, partial [Salmonella enterica]
RGSAADSRIRDVLAEAPVVRDGGEPVAAGRGELTAAIREFWDPETTHPPLEDVRFRLKRGQMLGGCGPN